MAEQDQDDKTEAPTPKKLEDARKKGQVAQSREVATLALLSAATAAVSPVALGWWNGLTPMLTSFLERPHRLAVDQAGLADVFLGVLQAAALIVAVPLVAFAIAGALAYVGQTGFLWTAEPLTPKLSKLSPLAGLKRLFGPKALIEALKSVLKIAVVTIAVGFALAPLVPELVASASRPLVGFGALLSDGAVRIGGVAVLVAVLVAVIDVAYQRYTHHEQLKMTRQQIKDEHKDSDGDPHVKQRIRQIRADRMRHQLAAEVPKATVVITNPTHVSVALRYERGENAAPKVVAKGIDQIALHIRTLAREHDVPLVENPPLARSLNRELKVGETIPEKHYQAVAQVIGFVLAQRRG